MQAKLIMITLIITIIIIVFLFSHTKYVHAHMIIQAGTVAMDNSDVNNANSVHLTVGKTEKTLNS